MCVCVGTFLRIKIKKYVGRHESFFKGDARRKKDNKSFTFKATYKTEHRWVVRALFEIFRPLSDF